MVDVSPRPKTKSRTFSDVFWSAEVSSPSTTVSFAQAKQLRSFVDEKARLSPTVAKVLSAGAGARCPSSVLPATAMHSAYWRGGIA